MSGPTPTSIVGVVTPTPSVPACPPVRDAAVRAPIPLVIDAARTAHAQGVTSDMDAVKTWVRANCVYRHDNEFELVFLIACEIGEMRRATEAT